MAIWNPLNWISRRSNSDSRTFEIPEHLLASISTLAKHENRPEHELLLDILAAGLTQYSTKDRIWKKWESLTRREQEVTALVCLGFSNGEIAAHMVITESGVKFHLGNVFSKLRVKNRDKLRKKFVGWDFSAWLKLPQNFHLVT